VAILFGLVLLIIGADWLVKSSSALAKKSNMSDLAIGLTVVAFGTSSPELVVNTIASYQGHQDIVFGNVIGSNIFNLFFILGITGVITPLMVKSTTIWKEIPISLLGTITLYFLANTLFIGTAHGLSRGDGAILIFMFALFLFYVFHQLKFETHTIEGKSKPFSLLKTWSFIIVGLAGLILGAELVVHNAVAIATSMGVSEKMIGLTIVGAGTSLPELVTSVTAALKRKTDMAVGNIIGSNIFNILFILGSSSLIHPIEYDNSLNVHLYLLAGGTVFLFIAMFTGQKKKLDRWEAALLVICYLSYIIYLVKNEI
jgi:cation:H+ antiporter